MGRHIEKPCGTPTAYRRHYRMGEKPCGPCRRAYLHDQKRERKSFDGYEFEKPEPGWRQKAACKGSDLNWFPEAEDGATISACVAVCEGCSVRNQCLSAALAESTVTYDAGIRGGLTEGERKSLRRMLKVAS